MSVMAPEQIFTERLVMPIDLFAISLNEGMVFKDAPHKEPAVLTATKP